MEVRATPEERRALRLEVARHQVPEILAWAGALTLAVGIVNLLTVPNDAWYSWVVNIAFGPTCLLLALALRRGWLPAEAASWTWAVVSLALVVMLVNAFRLDPSAANFAYVVAVMTAFGPLTHAWSPFVVAAVGMLVVAVVGIHMVPGTPDVPDIIVCVVAVLISAVLLRLRIHAVNDLADSQARLDHLALYDPMTETLNRNGLGRFGPAQVANAERSGERLLVWFVDVRGLKAANDRFGHDYGDTVIRGVARALTGCVRANDLLVRWGGDEFVVVGAGGHGSAEDLNARVDQALHDDPGLDDGWARAVTVGFAAGSPENGLDPLISAADADMYRRRNGA